MSEENVDHCSFVSIHYIICECGETFPSEEALKTHLEQEHPHKRERKEYKCGICSSVYTSEDDCVRHYEANHLPVDINLDHCEAEDSDEFDAKSELEEGEIPAVEEGEIPVLSEEAVALEEAIAAIKEEAVEEGEIELEEGEIPIQIEMPRVPAKKKGRKIIPKTEPDPELIFLIQEGEKKGELVSMLRKSGRLPKGQRTVVCEMCGKYYASTAALRYHHRTHTGERPYKCNICPKTFAMPLFLQIHVRTHTGERPFECTACPKAFSNRAALLRHERVHTGEKPYKCPMCAKCFTQSNSMKLHVTTVHLKQPTPYKSRSRRLRAEERSRSGRAAPGLARRKVPAHVDSVEVLKNGLESYVLGPLKADLENLKADIDMLARGDLEENMNAVKSIDKDNNDVYEMRDDNDYEVMEEVLYEEAGGHCEVVTSL